MGKPFSSSELAKFNKIKELTLGVVRRLDNSKGLNIKRYENMFKVFEQDPDLFRKWDVLNSDELDSTIQIFELPFEEMRMNQIKDAARFLKIDLEDYIYYRQDDPRGIRSKMKIPVGYVHIKRMQQILSKKNHYAYEASNRSLKTGDVKGEDDKVASISEPEVYALAAIGGYRALEELLGPRGDNQEKKRQMYRQIAKGGYCTLDSMESTRFSSTTLNTINTYLLASGIRSDLINDTLQTEWTLNNNLRKRG